jgi:hypothetical protein
MKVSYIILFLIFLSSKAQQNLDLSVHKKQNDIFYIYRGNVLPGIVYTCQLATDQFFNNMVIKFPNSACEYFGKSYVIIHQDTIYLKKNLKTMQKKSELSSQLIVTSKHFNSFTFFTDHLEGRVMFYLLNNFPSKKNDKK